MTLKQCSPHLHITSQLGLILQIVARAGPVPWAELNLPEGRTQKACMVMLDKEKKKVKEALETAGEDAGAGALSPKVCRNPQCNSASLTNMRSRSARRLTPRAARLKGPKRARPLPATLATTTRSRSARIRRPRAPRRAARRRAPRLRLARTLTSRSRRRLSRTMARLRCKG